jgi:hypothetical protein
MKKLTPTLPPQPAVETAVELPTATPAGETLPERNLLTVTDLEDGFDFNSPMDENALTPTPGTCQAPGAPCTPRSMIKPHTSSGISWRAVNPAAPPHPWA